MYWFQYINTLYKAEYCNTSNEFDIHGVDLLYILHTTNIEWSLHQMRMSVHVNIYADTILIQKIRINVRTIAITNNIYVMCT